MPSRNRSRSRRNRNRNRSRRNRNRSRSRSRRRNRRRRSPRYTIQLPPIEQCTRKRSPNRIQTYCGKSSQIPLGYARRGTRYECLKKGFGTGRCSVYRFRD